MGECYLIGAGPGDPDLLTLRALQLLQQADVILYDRLVPAAVLERARRDAERVFVGKQPGDHTAQERINELLVHYARLGLRVARLKGGDPFIFGRGGEEIEVLAAHGIPYIVVPGITAALGAAAVDEHPAHPPQARPECHLRHGHVLDDESLDWSSLARSHQTVVFYMGVGHLPQIVVEVARRRCAGRAGCCGGRTRDAAGATDVAGTLETIVSDGAGGECRAAGPVDCWRCHRAGRG